MMNLEIKKHSIIKCINSIELEYQRYSKSEMIEFIKDETYIVEFVKNSVICVKFDNDKTIKFVLDSTIYDAPQFDKHFVVTSNKLNEDSLGQFNGKSLDLSSFDDEKLRYSHYSGSELKLCGIGYEFYIYGHTNSKYNLSKLKHINKLKIRNLAGTISNINCIKELTIQGDSKVGERKRNEEEMNYFNDSLDKTIKSDLDKFLDITKLKLEKLKLNSVTVKQLNPVDKLDIRNCIIDNLDISKNLKYLNISNCIIKNCNKKYFQNKFLNSEYIKTIICLDDNTYIVSDYKDTFTLNETIQYCVNLQLFDFIEYFNFNLTDIGYKLTKKNYSNEITDTLYYMFDESKIYLNVSSNDHIKIFEDFEVIDKKTFNRSCNIDFVIDKDSNIIPVLDEYDFKGRLDFKGKLINDELLNRILKFSENELIPEKFFYYFLNNSGLSMSKNIGEINIKDFDFKMFEDDFEDIEYIKLIKKEKTGKLLWYYTKYSDSYSRVYEIDWSEYKFKISTNTKIGYYLNPFCKNYQKLSKNDIDQYYILNNKNTQLLFDENIEYKIDLDDKHYEKLGLYLSNDSKNIYIKNNSSKSKYHFLSTCEKIGIKDAEKIAKKYKFKLDLNKISSDKYDEYLLFKPEYNYNENISNKFEFLNMSCIKSDDRYAKYDISDLISNVINLSDKFQHIEDPAYILSIFLKIGNNIIYLNSETIHILSINNDELTMTKINNDKFENILKENNYKFSIINLDVKDSIIKKVEKFFEANMKYLYEMQKISYTYKTPHLYMSLLDSYLNNTQHIYYVDDKVEWQKSTDQAKKLGQLLIDDFKCMINKPTFKSSDKVIVKHIEKLPNKITSDY